LISQHTKQAHLQFAQTHRTKPKLQKSLLFATLKEFQNFSFYASKKLKSNSYEPYTTERRASANIGFARERVSCFV